MATKQPKKKKPDVNISVDVKNGKGKRKRTRTDRSKIAKCLMIYSAARAASDEAIQVVTRLRNNTDVNTLHDVANATKKIRLALKEIRSAKIDIREELKMNDWVRSMVEHLTSWEENLDLAWEQAQEIADDI